MKRSTLLTRKTRIRARNPKRAAKRRAEAFGEQARVCRSASCCVCWPDAFSIDSPRMLYCTMALARIGFGGERSEPHHIPSRGAGGTDKDCVPLCTAHHREFHDIGEQSFAERYAVDLRAIARRIHEVLAS